MIPERYKKVIDQKAHECAEFLETYCLDNIGGNSCAGCIFAKPNDGCVLSDNVPCDWEIPAKPHVESKGD